MLKTDRDSRFQVCILNTEDEGDIESYWTGEDGSQIENRILQVEWLRERNGFDYFLVEYLDYETLNKRRPKAPKELLPPLD